MMSRRMLAGLGFVTIAAFAGGVRPSAVLALTPLNTVRSVPDVPVMLGAAVIHTNELAEDDLSASVVAVTIAGIPSNAIITAYDRLDGGDELLSFDIDVSLPGGLTARPGDVVRFDGATFSLLFDAAANGIPRGVLTDAVSAIGPDDLLLSFDVTVDLGVLVASDSDIVRLHGGVFSLLFDAASAGVAPGLDLDAVHCIQGNGHLLISFDGSGVLGGVPFDDEDVLEYTPILGSVELAYDGDAEHAGWFGADLQAVSATTDPPEAISDPVPGPPPPNTAGGDTVFPGSTRVSGRGAPRAKAGDTCIEIYAAGANGAPDEPPGSIDDVLLGIGGTDESGAFVAPDGTPGIPVAPPLSRGQLIFATDVCAERTGIALRVSFAAPAPALSLSALFVATLLLSLVGTVALNRRGEG